MNAPPLQISGLRKSFTTGGTVLPWKRSQVEYVHAIDALSLTVERGQVYGVIGANGSGKSTLVRVVSTLLLPDAGEVRVFGIDAAKHATKVRPFINRVSVDPSFFKNMSTIENLLFFSRIYGFTRRHVMERAPEIMERLGFDWGKAREPMSHLSRGQQQKVALARSFLTSPVLLLLDEPTTGLDPRSKKDVQKFILDILEEHDATVLLTTHDMEEAELLCQRIAFLSHGKVVAEGTPLELRKEVAGSRPLATITMETVFMDLTGESLEEDEERKEVTT